MGFVRGFFTPSDEDCTKLKAKIKGARQTDETAPEYLDQRGLHAYGVDCRPNKVRSVTRGRQWLVNLACRGPGQGADAAVSMKVMLNWNASGFFEVINYTVDDTARLRRCRV